MSKTQKEFMLLLVLPLVLLSSLVSVQVMASEAELVQFSSRNRYQGTLSNTSPVVLTLHIDGEKPQVIPGNRSAIIDRSMTSSRRMWHLSYEEEHHKVRTHALEREREESYAAIERTQERARLWEEGRDARESEAKRVLVTDMGAIAAACGVAGEVSEFVEEVAGSVFGVDDLLTDLFGLWAGITLDQQCAQERDRLIREFKKATHQPNFEEQIEARESKIRGIDVQLKEDAEIYAGSQGDESSFYRYAFATQSTDDWVFGTDGLMPKFTLGGGISLYKSELSSNWVRFGHASFHGGVSVPLSPEVRLNPKRTRSFARLCGAINYERVVGKLDPPEGSYWGDPASTDSIPIEVEASLAYHILSPGLVLRTYGTRGTLFEVGAGVTLPISANLLFGESRDTTSLALAPWDPQIIRRLYGQVGVGFVGDSNLFWLLSLKGYQLPRLEEMSGYDIYGGDGTKVPLPPAGQLILDGRLSAGLLF